MDHPALLAAIGRALALDGPYAELSGEREQEINVVTGWMPPRARSLTVLGGAVDAHGRVAWIEEEVYGSEEIDQPVLVNDPSTGELVETTQRETWVHSSIDLRTAADGKERCLDVELNGKPRHGLVVPTYNPYFGCEVGRMEWFGDVIVTLYREKHETIAWAVPLDGEPRLVTIGSAVVVRGDALYFHGDEPGILKGLSLPDLAPLVPIPTATTLDAPAITLDGDDVIIARPGWWDERDEDTPVERVRLPPRGARLDAAEAAALPARVIEAIFGVAPPQPAADLLVGAALSPFYDPRLRLRRDYYEAYEHWFSPHWLPAYWHRWLIREGRAAEAAAHLAAIDAAAAKTPGASGGVPATAEAHVIQRARVIAEVCRTGRLPDRWSCPFWPRTDNVFRKHPPAAAPVRLVEAMGLMDSRPPPQFGTYYSPAE